MTLSQKKKILYKEKPVASLLHSDEATRIYWCETSAGAIHFKIPVVEAAGFKDSEPGQLLIRWLN